MSIPVSGPPPPDVLGERFEVGTRKVPAPRPFVGQGAIPVEIGEGRLALDPFGQRVHRFVVALEVEQRASSGIRGVCADAFAVRAFRSNRGLYRLRRPTRLEQCES